MTENKRFTLKSIHFNKLTVDLFDNQEAKHLHLSIYELVDLLNNVSKQEYDLLKLREDVCKKIDLIIDADKEEISLSKHTKNRVNIDDNGYGESSISANTSCIYKDLW